MTFIYGGAACGLGIYYKSYSAMYIIKSENELRYVLNVQFCRLMTFIYGGAAVGMEISSDSAVLPGQKGRKNSTIPVT